MAITAHTGPLITFGQATPSSAPGTPPAEYNGQAGPSLLYQGVGILDLRPSYTYKVGAPVTTTVTGWWGTNNILCVDAQISAAATNSLALTQTSTTTTTKSVVLSSVNTANATIGVSIKRADTGATVTGLLAIEGAAGTITFGSDATVAMWDPSTMVSRAVRFQGSSDDSGGVYTISGYDVYGYPMTEIVTGSISTTPNSTFTLSKKAWKYISTIVASGTLNSTGLIIGVADTFGFPIAVKDPGKVEVFISSGTTSYGLVSAASTAALISASTVATQTSTTPDVRGTFVSTTAASSQGRLFSVYVSPSPAALNSSGFFGAQQA